MDELCVMGSCQNDIAFGMLFLGVVGGFVVGVILRDFVLLFDKGVDGP